MKLHSLFLIFALFLFGCATEGTDDHTDTHTVDSLIIDEATEDVVDVVKIKKSRRTLEKEVKDPSEGTKEVLKGGTSGGGEVGSSSLTDKEEEPKEVEITSPVFFDCDHKKRDKSKARCSEKELQNYLANNLEFAGEEGSEHYASVSISIRTNGSVGLVTILGSSTPEFGEAVKKTVKQLNADGLIWTPAYKGDEAVPFTYFTEFEVKF